MDYSIWTEKENYKLFPNGFYRKLLLKLIFNQIFQIAWLSGEHALLPSSTPISGCRLHIVLWLAWMLPRLAWILLRLACLWLNCINGKGQLYDIGWNVYSLQMLYVLGRHSNIDIIIMTNIGIFLIYKLEKAASLCDCYWNLSGINVGCECYCPRNLMFPWQPLGVSCLIFEIFLSRNWNQH